MIHVLLGGVCFNMVVSPGDRDLDIILCSSDSKAGKQDDGKQDTDAGSSEVEGSYSMEYSGDRSVDVKVKDVVGSVIPGTEDDPGESSDFLAERVFELSQGMPSKQAMHLGKFLLRNGVVDELAGYVVDNFTSMSLSRSQRIRASRLFRRWFANHNFLRKGYRSVSCPVIGDTVKVRIDALVSAIPGVVSSEETYLVASRLLDLQSDVAVDSLEYDLKVLGDYSHVLPALPDDLKSVFYSSLDRSVDLNRGERDLSVRRRYNHLGSLLSHLEPFTQKHCVRSYGAARKLSLLDTKNILHPLYRHIASLHPDTPDNVVGVVSDVLGLIPEGSSLDDAEVRGVDDFLGRLLGSFADHEPFEVGTFFELCKNLYADPAGDADPDAATDTDPALADDKVVKSPVLRYDEYSFDDSVDGTEEDDPDDVDDESGNSFSGVLGDYEVRLSLLTASGLSRREHNVLGCAVGGFNNLLEDRIKYIGLEYLKMSESIIMKRGVERAREFADRVKGFNNVGNGPAQVLQDMELYKKGVIDRVALSEEEENMLGRALLRERKETTARREVLRRYNSVVSDGPVPCPDHLKGHLMSEFGVEVSEIWDFRRNQFTLYFDRSAADNYDRLRRRKIDKMLIRKVASELHEMDLLERHLLWYGGGCGFAKAELAFYDELKRMGYDVHMDLVDRSRVMLSSAALLCARSGVDADVFELDLEKLNMKDLEKDRQVVFGLWGGTAFNWLERYMTFKRYHTIFRKRDSLTPDGIFVYPRFYGDGDRKKDILLVEGDLVKDPNHYRDALSKLFLANGLAGEYDLTPDMLSRDGELCHTVYFHRPSAAKVSGSARLSFDAESVARYEQEGVELQCIYLVTKDKGPFRKDQAILVIDSGTLHEEEFRYQMGFLDYDSHFIRGDRDNAVAVCSVTDGLRPFLRRR